MDDKKQETASLRAVVYVRISDDPEGTERGVDRQEADCRAHATGHGMTVVEVFRENDTSAFKQRTITLPAGGSTRPCRNAAAKSKPTSQHCAPSGSPRIRARR